jgi:hypothetical protein
MQRLGTLLFQCYDAKASPRHSLVRRNLNDGDLIAQYIGFDPKRTLAALQVLTTGS